MQGVILRTGCCLRAEAWALPLMRPSLSPFLLSPAPNPLSFNFCSQCKGPAGERELAHILPIGLSLWVKVITEPVAGPWAVVLAKTASGQTGSRSNRAVMCSSQVVDRLGFKAELG